MAIVAIRNARKGAHPDRHHQKPQAQPENQQARILVHAINDDRCVGCDACVAVCPTNVLDLISNKSRVLRFQDCIQCEQCMWACPTEALVMHLEGTEPPRIKMPDINENFETAVEGQYLIGEVAGKPLVKNAANLGRAVVEHMLRKGGLQAGAHGGDVLDVAIVGSGPAGLSAALTCIRNGLSYAVLEKEQMIASTVSRYPKGKWVMAEPYDVRNLSYLPVFDSSKEQMVPIWQQVVDGAQINLKKAEPVEEVKKADDGLFDVRTTQGAYRAQRVVLAIGTRGKPRTLGVPGENLPKVESLLEDPDDHRGKSVLVVGGGDSALEAAMALADAGSRVVLSYRGRSFNRAQKKNQAAIESYDAQKRIKVLYESNVTQFTEDTVTIKLKDGQDKSYPNEAAFMLIGAEPPVKWLQKVGVHVVDRPHSFSLGKTDEVLLSLCGEDGMVDCPEDAQAAVHLAREGSLPAAVVEQQAEMAANKTMMFTGQPLTGPKGWLKSAKTMFTQALRIDQPMSLSEFANRGGARAHSHNGRRDSLSASERTRVLRMLRDEGGRLADEDTKMLRVGDVRPDLVPPPAQPAQQGFGQTVRGTGGKAPAQSATMFAHGAPAPKQPAPQPQPLGQQPAYQPQAQPPGQPAYQPQAPSPSAPQRPGLPAYQPEAQQPPVRSSHAAATMLARPEQQQAPQSRAAKPPVPVRSSQAHAAYQPPQPAASGGGGAFDDEPTRQVDSEEALAAFLEAENHDDANATRTMDVGYHRALDARATKYGGFGSAAPRGDSDFPSDDVQEPTRAVDPFLRSSGEGDATGNLNQGAPTQAINLNQMGRMPSGGTSTNQHVKRRKDESKE
ncbi:4Fe-4S ferredoxin iron-sulfur binding domain protein [Haliangium ochraceum DSM 14365]|uniref:4Fe-4S ferredoxin iron-sulfur binding domain protein n=2 Tax=Haliangium ochraceum TaxID=80816 RepID=D0LGI0_HALO1|nr:4Fe-4S ferredoxin iron-sulfur binding domain protein [Haliangium ochraceum DSM 14365]